jgi:hypothetical protein
MLIGGMDVSGDKLTGNYKYLAIVIGTKESIQSQSDKISQKTTRMSQLTGQTQNRIIKTLHFDCKNRITFCITLNRTKIIEQVKNARAVKKDRTPTGNILRTFNYVVIRKVLPQMQSYALANSMQLTEIVFECDSDCEPFAKIANVKSTKEGKAHNIADKVAWCNNKNKNLPSVIDIDFTNEIVSKMLKVLNL